MALKLLRLQQQGQQQGEQPGQQQKQQEQPREQAVLAEREAVVAKELSQVPLLSPGEGLVHAWLQMRLEAGEELRNPSQHC